MSMTPTNEETLRARAERCVDDACKKICAKAGKITAWPPKHDEIFCSTIADFFAQVAAEAALEEHIRLCPNCIGLRIKSGTGNAFTCARRDEIQAALAKQSGRGT